MKNIVLCVTVFIVLTGLCCKDEPTKSSDTTFDLSVEDASCTEVWLKLKIGSSITNREVTLMRDSIVLFTRIINETEIIITDTNLTPNHAYTFTAQRLQGSLVSCSITTMDTTSHAWTFTQTLLGDGTGSSSLYDVAIINDTLAYAVGEIYQGGVIYNAVKWDGQTWNLQRLPYIYNGSPIYSSIRWIYVIDVNDIWFGNSVHWNGTQFHNVDIGTSIFYGIGSNKMWGTPNGEYYVVGNSGTIAYSANYGSTWTKLESPEGTGGTTLDIYDIYGAINSTTGKQEILGVGAKIGSSFDRIIIKINGTTVSAISDSPISYSLESIWFIPGRHYYVVGDGMYEKKLLSDTNWKNVSQNILTSIRGNSINDILTVGISGRILHYNGFTWMNYREQTGLPNSIYSFVDIKENLFVAVGSDNRYGIILIGRRM